jgi:hypothetical protein
MTRMHLPTRAVHRVKRTPFSEDRPEGTLKPISCTVEDRGIKGMNLKISILSLE